MTRQLGALGLVLAIASLVFLLGRDRVRPAPRASRDEPGPVATPAAPEARGDLPAPATTEKPAPGRATVCGTVRYADGGPAAGLRVDIGLSDRWATTDADGTFRFPDVEPDAYYVGVNESPFVSGFHVAAGETRDFDLEIARGGVTGVIVDADTGEPIGEIVVELRQQPELGTGLLQHDLLAGRGLATFTGKDGKFDLRGAPPGNHLLVARGTVFWERVSAYETQAVACSVGASDTSVTLRLRRARPLQIRFENVPETMLRLAVRIRDRSGRLPDLQWGSGEAPLELVEAQRRPAPPPGEYELVTVATGRQPITWLSQPLSIPEGPVAEQTIRLPDGAPVVIESPALPGEGGFFLRVGPILVFENAVEEFRIPYVPEGHHGIWRLFPAYEVRIGEVTVTAGREARLVIPRGGTATLRGRPDPFGDDPAQLRDTRGEVVAQQEAAFDGFAFGLLPAGSYVLEIGDRRFPVTLAEGEDKDLGLRGPGGATRR